MIIDDKDKVIRSIVEYEERLYDRNKRKHWYIKIIVINRDLINLKLRTLESNEILVFNSDE